MGLIRTLHAWVGALLALLLIITGLTGAALVFKADYIRAALPQARAAASADPAALGAAAERIEAVHGGHVQRMVFAGPRLGVHQVFFHEGSYGYADGGGRMVAEWSGPTRPETFVYDLHHFLLMGDKGMKVVGWGGLIACFLALSGLIVWIPTWRAWSFWPRSAQRRDLLGTHRSLGILFALPVLLFSLTGASIIFYQTTQNVLNNLLPGPQPEEFFSPPYPGDIDWPKALATAKGAFPRAELRMAIWPAGPWAPAIVRLRQPGELSPDGETEALIDPESGRLLGTKQSQGLAPGIRLYRAISPIHTAAIGGRLYDVLAFLSGLAMAGLGVLGLWSFIIKPRRRRRG